VFTKQLEDFTRWLETADEEGSGDEESEDDDEADA
jgi:hypothetical protein